jgi:hypothetical protein
MESLLDFALQERYKRVVELGDKVSEFDTLIEWDRFRPIIGDLYTNTTEQGGRPNHDVILMVRLLVLQSMYGLSDPELERQANDKISFLKFLGFPEKIPDHSTIWYFRERLINQGKLELIWKELQRQQDAMGLKIKKVRSKMPHSSLLIRDMLPQASSVETKPENKKAKKVHGRKRIPSHILGLKSIPKKTVIMDLSENSRLQLHHST